MKKMLPILIFILYFVLFHVPVRKEFVQPLLAASALPSELSASPGSVPLLSFSGIHTAGYIDDKGDVIFSRTSDYPVQTAAGYCLLMNEKGSYSLFNISGDKIADFKFNGTADFMDEALFVRSYDFRGLSTYTKGGTLIWSRQFGNPVISYKSSSGLTAVGLSDGSLLLLNAEGRIVYEEKFDYAGVPCVYALSLSEDADRIAVIHGNSPQFLHVVSRKEKGETEFSDLIIEELDSDFRKDVFLFFSPDQETLCYKTEDGLGFYSFRKKETGKIKTGADVISAVLAEDGTFAYMITDAAGQKRVVFADLESGELRQGEQFYDYLSLSLNGDRLLLVAGNKKIRLDEDGFREDIAYNLYLYGLEKQ